MEEENIDSDFTKEAPKHIQRVSKDTVNKLLSAQVKIQFFYIKFCTGYLFDTADLIRLQTKGINVKFIEGNT